MYSFDSFVRYSEVDSELNITLPAILTFFQDCSILHSDSLGMGVEEMMEDGHMWILSSWQIIVDRYPRIHEKLRISTWAHGWKGFFGFRNFKMEDEEGNMVAYANTNWIYTDMHAGRPVKIPKEVSDLYSIEPPLDMEMTSRKIAIPATGEAMEPYAVRRSDIDNNMHVNNAHYVLIAQDYLPENFVIRQLRAEYRNSAKFGDVMYPVVTNENDKITVVLNDENGKPYAIVEVQS